MVVDSGDIVKTIGLPETGLDALRSDPGFQRYLARVALAPAMYEGFYEDQEVFHDLLTTDETPSGNHYAWIQMPLWLHQRDQARRQTEKGPFTTLDLCSSVPLYAELHNSKNFTRCFRYARSLVNSAVNESDRNYGRLPERDSEDLRLVRSSIMKNKMLRNIYISHVRRVLFGFDEEEVPPATDRESTEQMLVERLMYETCVGTEVYSTANNTGNFDGRRKVDTTISYINKPLLDLLSDSQVPTDSARRIRDVILGEYSTKPIGATTEAEQEQLKQTEDLGMLRAVNGIYLVTRRIAQSALNEGLVRSYRSISADLADPLELYETAETSFDSETKKSGLYHRARARTLLGKNHVTADVADERFWAQIPDASISLITSIEGIPYHFEDLFSHKDSEGIIPNIARHIFRVLQAGGHFVSFPWTTPRTQSRTRENLQAMRGVWLSLGADITIKPYEAGEIKAAAHSPVSGTTEASTSPMLDDLEDTDELELMIVTKDKGRLRLNKKRRTGSS